MPPAAPDQRDIPYPATSAARNAWVLAHRPERQSLPAIDRPAGYLVEDEPDATGRLQSYLTAFLVNRECPWRCVFCDLWQHTVPDTVPAGTIPKQLRMILDQPETTGCASLKLYNAGSFFDAAAIPRADHAAIAAMCRRFERVIVECHPALIGPPVLQFQELIAPARLEVALGLETAHEETLIQLNKGITRASFAKAVDWLRERHMDARAFVLVRPPFLEPAEGLDWVFRSIEFAFATGSSVVSLIPTRLGNGSLEALAARGQFVPPRLVELESALEHGLRLQRGRVFADVWELDRWAGLEPNFAERKERLIEMNRRQQVLPFLS